MSQGSSNNSDPIPIIEIEERRERGGSWELIPREVFHKHKPQPKAEMVGLSGNDLRLNKRKYIE